MAAPPTTHSRRHPTQERSRALVEAILDATADVLRVHGLERATTTRIAERAGVSVGSLYQYFPNKTALYKALGDRYFARLLAATDTMWPVIQSAPARQAIELAVHGIIATAFVDPVLDRILHRVAITRIGFEPVAAYEANQEARLAALLEDRREDLPRRDLDAALVARLLTRAIGGIISSTFAREPELASEPHFVGEVVTLVERYLGYATTDAGPPDG